MMSIRNQWKTQFFSAFADPFCSVWFSSKYPKYSGLRWQMLQAVILSDSLLLSRTPKSTKAKSCRKPVNMPSPSPLMWPRGPNQFSQIWRDIHPEQIGRLLLYVFICCCTSPTWTPTCHNFTKIYTVLVDRTPMFTENNIIFEGLNHATYGEIFTFSYPTNVYHALPRAHVDSTVILQWFHEIARV